jgi:hypothetical protein
MLIHRGLGVCLYALVIVAIIALAGRLGVHVATEAAVVALPYLADSGAQKLSLMERRQLTAATSQPRRGRWARKVTALKPPSASARILAASLDVAETSDLPNPEAGVTVPPLALSQPSPFDLKADIRHNQRQIRSAQLRSSASAHKHRTSAADEFNRRFGVLVAGPQMADAR